MAEPTLTLEEFVQEVRHFLRDFPELNRLLSGHETSDRLIGYCVMLALDEFNTTPPLIGNFGVGTFPSRHLLLNMTVAHVLQSAAHLSARNKMTYNDGTSIDSEPQERLYFQWIQLLRSQTGSRVRELKVALNIQGGWGSGVESEYAWLNSWYGLI